MPRTELLNCDGPRHEPFLVIPGETLSPSFGCAARPHRSPRLCSQVQREFSTVLPAPILRRQHGVEQVGAKRSRAPGGSGTISGVLITVADGAFEVWRWIADRTRSDRDQESRLEIFSDTHETIEEVLPPVVLPSRWYGCDKLNGWTGLISRSHARTDNPISRRAAPIPISYSNSRTARGR